MKHNNRKHFVMAAYAAAVSVTLLTGFQSFAAENDINRTVQADFAGESGGWSFSEVAGGIQGEAFQDTAESVEKARTAYAEKVEEERRAEEERRQAEEAARLAQEQAEAQAAAAAEEQKLLAALIFCEAGNQPYEGQVAVGAVVMNRVKSGTYPNTITDVIYQSGQFGPAMTGWLDSVLASGSYTDAAMQAAADAIAGSNPVGECLYFGNGNWGIQIGDHYFH